MKKRILLAPVCCAVGVLLCACQSDLSRPADYVFDARNSVRVYDIDISGLEYPGTSKTFLFEVTNTSGEEKEYIFETVVRGELPLVYAFSNVDGNPTGRIGNAETHQYILTVSRPETENSYLYAGGLGGVSVEVFTK